MKNRIPRMLAALLCATMILLLTFGACGSNNEGSSTANSSKSSSNSAAEENSVSPAATGEVTENVLPIANGDVNLSIYCGFASGARQVYNSMAEMDVVKEMMKETGINLTFVHPPEQDDGTFFTTMIASGDYPDIISNEFKSYPGGPTAAMDDGVIIDATELILSKASYFNQVLDKLDPEVREKKIWSDDGRIIRFGTVFVPEYLDGHAHGGFLVRKDLLDAAGITELPTTIAEYETMFEAFQKQGKLPWTLAMKEWQNERYSPVASAFGVTYRKTHIEDDKIIYSRTSPRYKEYLEVMNRWYEKGFFNSDSLTQLTAEAQKKFQAGDAGAIICGSWEVITLESVGQANDPAVKVVGLPYPRTEKGDSIDMLVEFLENPDPTRSAFISAQCENPEAAVRFVDYLYRPETVMMTAWGVNTEEHTLWTEDASGNRSWTDFMMDNPDFDYEIGRQRYTANALQGEWETQMEKLQYDIPQVQQAWSAWEENTTNKGVPTRFITQTTEEAREISQLLTQIETFGDETVFAFITGQKPLDEFDSFVEELKALGTDRLCELYQAAYDRYLARGQ